ncbi:hypothetical protein M441DRAFT_126041 [Trichoderma asperellum CBS 433.97]|uniref:Uncharacterized protein n=1 Tax=Trichoderma asperellum (strain ATCC 204424 / CBS 433.97 / NBRC 101777) TaxID=1042311 RepID=A0A2T3ZPB3_TRIA4|nr:hypothetical protein M441DRAFT_126041 [Trichoderma asperellum CBS 433.97]PTB46645.1 hypothetical protein M441DRAFT_126041 [Trichoderma asperellum CBS 433.97]
MDEQDGFAEFYIACNPPLLSRGVEYIVQSVKSACPNGELAEILYEPDIPWFKCITMGKHKESVTRIIKDLLIDLVTLEVEPLGFDAEKDVIDTNVLQADVAMKAAEPRLISWMVYQSLGSDIHDTFVKYQYPEAMASLPYKAIWRGLENSSGTFEDFLSEFRRLIKSENAPATAADFALRNECHISYNMRENLVYIGSSTSAAALEKVVKKLETVLNLLASKIKTTTHSILPEGPEELRLAYRWLHRIGLHQATFAVPCGNLTVADEYKLLLNAAAIRTEKKDKYGRWISDDTVYPLINASRPDVGQKFKAFKTYFPHPKPRFADIRAIPYGLQPETEEVSSSAEAQGPIRAPNNLEPALLEQGAESCHEGSGPELYDREEPPFYHQRSILDQKAYISPGEEEGLAEFVQRLRFAETLTLNPPQQSNGGSLLIDWVEGIESATQSESAMNDFNQEEALISFELSNESQCGSETFDIMEPNPMAELRSLQSGIKQLEQFEQSDDLIFLDNEPEVPRANIMQDSGNYLADMCLLSSGIPQAEDIFSPVLNESTVTLDENNPLEAREINSYSDSLVRFGLMEEKPREIYRTMNQRASRPKNKSTKGSQSPTKNRAAAKGERQSTKTPGKGGSSLSEDKFPPLGGGPSSSKKPAKIPLSYSDAAKLPKSQTLQERRKVANLKITNEQPRPLSTEAFPPTSDVGTKQSKEPRDSVPDKTCDYTVPQKSDILRHSEDRLKRMSQILELAPGYVSLEVVFGRIYIKKLAPSIVKDSASDYSYQSVTEAVNFLNRAQFPQDCVGFSPILSTMGGDADVLVDITPPGELPWHLSEKEIWYDFQCKFPDSRGESFVLELNAKTFQYRCRGPRQELFAMYMHCPERAWDMKAYGARSTALGSEARFVCFAASLFEHMDIYVADSNGDVTIEFSENTAFQTAVQSITMRQVAKYRHQKKADSSILCITMKHLLEEGISPVMCDRGQVKIGERRHFDTPDGASNSALPHQYLEASITSSRLSSFFEENVQLESGNKAAWDIKQLESEGVFEDILRPAFGMITHMDHIGASNNTMRYVSNHDAFHEALVVSAGKKKKLEFW